MLIYEPGHREAYGLWIHCPWVGMGGSGGRFQGRFASFVSGRSIMNYSGWQREGSPGRWNSTYEGQEAGEIRAHSGDCRHPMWLEHGCEAGIRCHEAGEAWASRP